MRERAKKVIKGALIISMIGALYGIAVNYIGFGIPCVFKLITHLDCPGCGVTRMCSALLRFDFSAALRANTVLFFLLPFMALLAGRLIYVYIKKGIVRDRFSQPFIWIMIVVLLIWGIIRNLI